MIDDVAFMGEAVRLSGRSFPKISSNKLSMDRVANEGEDFRASALIAFGVGNIERDKSFTGGVSTATSSKSNSSIGFFSIVLGATDLSGVSSSQERKSFSSNPEMFGVDDGKLEIVGGFVSLLLMLIEGVEFRYSFNSASICAVNSSTWFSELISIFDWV